MVNFTGQGYFTLAQLDALAAEIQDLKDFILSGDEGLGDLFFYKNNATENKSVTSKLAIGNAGIDLARIKVALDNDLKITHQFGQDFAETPLVFASVESNKNNLVAQIVSTSKSGCVINFVSLNGTKATPKRIKGKTEWVNVLAIGKTKE
jgi:hypothetical protein